MQSILSRISGLKAVVIIALLALAPLFLFAPKAHAINLTDSVDSVGTGAGLTDVPLPELIGQLISIVLSFLGIIFLLLIIYAGFMWMTAGGSSEKVDKAKKLLINGVIGLVLILAAFAISSFVLGDRKSVV